MENQTLKKIRENTTKSLFEKNIIFDEVIYQKALAKAKRWMKLAYGSFNYEEYLQESGNVCSYYLECIAQPDGINTRNNDNARTRRREKAYQRKKEKTKQKAKKEKK